MLALGLDLGASSVKLALLENGKIKSLWMQTHQGRPFEYLQNGLEMLNLHEKAAVCVTGANSEALLAACPELTGLGDIPATVEGVRLLAPQGSSIMEIGSQGARFITGWQSGAPQFSVNEHCAGGTGSFFEDQMSRLGLNIEDYSRLIEEARSIPRLSGRCAVFAKTDIIHRQQEGVPTPDILLGLCYAMIHNYKATIVRNLSVEKPVVFCGGVTCNAGVIRAIRDVFDLAEDELIVPKQARYASAIGAACKAEGCISVDHLLDILRGGLSARRAVGELEPLVLAPGTKLTDPPATGVIPSEGCALGIDIGSTSTDLVLTGRDGTLVDFQYLRTAGNPEAAVRKGLQTLQQKYGAIRFAAVGVTGSGRERIGRMIGADAIRDEITAQAKGATFWVPDADTVFEIGGQDSKYIALRDGEVVDFQMNKICAAGTGSFVEEQAARMGIPIEQFGPLALTAKAPAALGERCTVFIETAIASAAAESVGQAEIAAGLCHAIVRNYLHKVVAGKPVGQHIVLQGGVDYNSGIVAAFQAAYGERVQVSPCFAISGAFGAAMLALEAVGNGESHFTGFDAAHTAAADDAQNSEIARNIAFYEQADKLLLEGYTGQIDPDKKTVGVPYVLMIHKFFPMANAFFSALGFNVVLTDPTSEETLRLSQLAAQGETCYPVKLIYGHMMQLIEKKVDYIFLPSIHTMRHEKSRVAHNYGCVYMQTAAKSVARALKLEEKGITLLNPEFDLDFGQEAMASAMVGLGKILGIPKLKCAAALLAGAMAVRRHTAAVEKQGKALLATLKPEDKVLVLITRNYGVSDPILNIGIPRLLLERGYKVITLSHLPGHSLDISGEYPNLYWPFGQHILSGAKLIAHHPNLYAVYLTNHGCGPDTMLAHLFRQEMGGKPYLQIEVDEHFSKVGVITRVEAFLNSLSHRPVQPLPANFQIEDVPIRRVSMPARAETDKPLYLPNLGEYTPLLARYFVQNGVDAHILPAPDEHAVGLGRAQTSAKEYLPFAALLGGVLAERETDGTPAQFLIPQSEGAEADGQYARVIRAELDSLGQDDAKIVAPMLERLYENAMDRDMLMRALLVGDLAYAAPKAQRNKSNEIPTWDELNMQAETIGNLPIAGRKIAVIGTPLCQTVLDDGVWRTLEDEGETILRAPLAEALCFLWRDSDEKGTAKAWLDEIEANLCKIGRLLGARSPFAPDMDALRRTANAALGRFAGANGRYRYAKAVQMSANVSAVLTAAPRYENAAMILDMRGLREACQAPLLELSFDHDWDETAWARLRSFLYYCR